MNTIHETAIIGKNVVMGDNNYIGPYCYITNNTKIGSNNRFEGFCSIGTPPEHNDYFRNTNGSVIIGDNNIIREYVTINSGIKVVTELKNDIKLLRNVHIGHDSIIHDKCNLACNVLIGGHSVLMEGVNMGLGSICHQFSVLGAYSMIGMNSTITKKSEVLPGNVYIGNPIKFLKINEVGLKRNNINEEIITKMTNKYKRYIND